ncbi:hypothetical protein TNCT_466121 [Trichonephila clavata]|uniref:Uncharacterized protein n=1 Tax=Trichonephila clavata TaxID=2740835 RepID=A0A8X6GNJ2_TRICU|nr:hypothetical protein TNCT_466121 [Trichonephila clavata]
MSKFWVFVYRNASDNHIIAAPEEFSDESAPLRRLGSSFGTKVKELDTAAAVPAPLTMQSIISTTTMSARHMSEEPTTSTFYIFRKCER